MIVMGQDLKQPLRAFIDVDGSVEGRVLGQPAPISVAGERLRGTIVVEGVGHFLNGDHVPSC